MCCVILMHIFDKIWTSDFIQTYAIDSMFCCVHNVQQQPFLTTNDYTSHHQVLVMHIMLFTCFNRESNTGPSDLQSDALPTELSKLKSIFLHPHNTYQLIFQILHPNHKHSHHSSQSFTSTLFLPLPSNYHNQNILVHYHTITEGRHHTTTYPT